MSTIEFVMNEKIINAAREVRDNSPGFRTKDFDSSGIEHFLVVEKDFYEAFARLENALAVADMMEDLE